MNPQLSEQARGKWRSILTALGIETRYLENKQGPCPLCGGKDRYRFDDKDGAGTWICNVCGAGDGASLVMATQGVSFAQAAKMVREQLPTAQFIKPKAARSADRCHRDHLAMWRSSKAIGDDMAEAYLRGRAIIGPYPPSLRFVESALAMKADEGRLPALIAKVSDVSGKGVNIHRTFLRGGDRVYRAMMPGEIPDGAAVRLSEPAERMGIAEGIETAMRASSRFGLPVWSAINATMLEKWIPPHGVRSVVVFGDNDASFTGHAASYALARKLVLKHKVVAEVVIPQQVGMDWADDDAKEHR